jgi:Concanavalin A-like lectin/glucanases superfamily/Alginate lyase
MTPFDDTLPTDTNAASPATPQAPTGLARRRMLQGLGAVPMLAALSACGGGSSPGDSDSSNSTDGRETEEVAGARSFKHPGLLHTEVDFTRMRDKLAKGEQPWVDGWNALTNSGRAQLGRAPTPLETVIRGGPGENHRTMVEDMQRAYQFALRWKVSGDTAYADMAVTYLNAWSSTMRVLTGTDAILAGGLYGYQWANAGEIMRTYPGWAAADITRWQALLLDQFYPPISQFLVDHHGSKITHFWANWDLQAICGILAIGIFCDRPDLYDEAVSYYKTGRGNGSVPHMVHYVHPGFLGQWQESPRDMGHATLGISLSSLLCEMAWNQGDDFYSLWNNRLLAGAEYMAKANLRDAQGVRYVVPFTPYTTNQGTFTAAATDGPNARYAWEAVYNHYANRKGLSTPYVATIAASLRPEKLDWVGDEPGFGTLPYSRDPYAALNAPSGVAANIATGRVTLSWWGSAKASSYRVKRATSASGPFTTIATVTDPRSYTDVPPGGVWFYVVTSLGNGAESAASAVVRAATRPELIVNLPLNEGSGSTAADTAGRARNGQLASGAAWGAGRNSGSALLLDGKAAHVALPANALAQVSDFTVSVWVYWNAVSTNARVFDFGTSDIAYMALIPQDGGGKLRFTATRSHYFGEQSITATSGALPTGRWAHVAVKLMGTIGKLYLDGVQVGETTGIVVTPFQLGDTPNAWLGRSQYGADPYFNGRMQDLRIYSGALSNAQIAALAAG